MDDPAAIRAVLREHGIEVPDRGRISAEHMASYESIKAGTYQAGDDEGWVGADEPGPAGGDDPGWAPPADEKPPRRPGRAGTTARAKGWWDHRKAGAGKKATPKAKPKPGKVQHPRVRVDDLIATGWDWLGRMAKPVSVPVSRTFSLQAPVAGMVLEDAVRGTIVDKALQPLARMQGRGRAVAALAGPPMIVALREQAEGLPEPARSFRINVLDNMLEECMLLWIDVAGDKFEAAAARAEQRERDREEARAIIASIFEGPKLCGQVVAQLPDRTNIVCIRPLGHEGEHAVSEDQAAAYAQAMAGV